MFTSKMKKLANILIIFLLYHQAHAQLKMVVQEDFSSNIHQWKEDEHKSISEGTLNFNSTEEGDQATISFFIDPQQPFEISADFVQHAVDSDGALL